MAVCQWDGSFAEEAFIEKSWGSPSLEISWQDSSIYYDDHKMLIIKEDDDGSILAHAKMGVDVGDQPV